MKLRAQRKGPALQHICANWGTNIIYKLIFAFDEDDYANQYGQ